MQAAGACVLCVLNTLLWYSSEEAFQYSRQKGSRDWPDLSEYCLLVDMKGLQCATYVLWADQGEDYIFFGFFFYVCYLIIS